MSKRPIIIEVEANKLSTEALDWLAHGTTDLSWSQYSWRIWDEIASDDELSILERLTKRHYPNSENPIRRRVVDAVFFASNKDAVYFKMRFL